MAQMLELFHKDFKVAIIITFQWAITKTPETKIKVFSKEMKIFNKEMYKDNPIDILELKNTVTKTSNSMGGLNSRKEMTEKRISKLENGTREIIYTF